MKIILSKMPNILLYQHEATINHMLNAHNESAKNAAILGLE